MVLTRVRYSARSLSRDPFFSLVAMAVLAIGIATNTAMFSVIDQILLNPLPYRDSSTIVMVWETNPALGEPAGSHVPVAWYNFAEWGMQRDAFQGLEAFEMADYNVTGLSSPEHVTSARATSGFFQLLGINAIHGRTFTPDDSKSGSSPVAIVSAAFEIAHFVQGAVGHKILLNGAPYTIVGGLPADFRLPAFFQGAYVYRPDVWLAMQPPTSPESLRVLRLFVFGRLNSNISIAQARSQMVTIAKRLEQAAPDLNKGYSANVVSLRAENTDPDIEHGLYILWAAALAVLLLGCANLSGLMLIRAVSKQKTLAIMRALGAPKQILIAEILLEGVLLSVVALGLAVLVAHFEIAGIRILRPGEISGIDQLRFNVKSFFFAAAALIFCALFFAALPALLSTRRPLNGKLKTSEQGSTGKAGFIFRRVLVCGEIGLALALSISAVLFLRSFKKLLEVDPGFRSENVLTGHVTLPKSRYPNAGDRQQFCEQLLSKVREFPMVRSASLADNFPLYSIHYTFFEIEGRPSAHPDSPQNADYANVTPDFFLTLGTPLRKGRFLAASDLKEGAEKVVLVNESLAAKYWPNKNPIDGHIRLIQPHNNSAEWLRIVGIVGDFRQFNIDTPARPEMFFPSSQYSDMTIALRSSGSSDMDAKAFKKILTNIDEELPMSDVQTLGQLVDHSIAQRRFNTMLLAVFATIGIFLALLGV